MRGCSARARHTHEALQPSAPDTAASVVLRCKALGRDECIEACAHAPHRRAHGGLRQRPSAPFQPCQEPSLRLLALRITGDHLFIHLLPQRVVKRHQGRAPRRQRKRCDVRFSLCGLALLGLETLPIPVLDDREFPRTRGDSLPCTHTHTHAYDVRIELRRRRCDCACALRSLRV